MAFATITATEPSSTSSNSATPTIALPAGTGNLVIVFGGKDGNGTVTWPAPWAELTDASFTGGMYTAAWAAVADLAGATSVVPTFTVAERSTFIAALIDGWHGTSAPELSTVATGNSANPDSSSVSASWGSADNLFISWFVADDSAAPFPVTGWPTNYADDQTQNAGAASSVDTAIAARGLAAASDDPGSFTMTGSETWAAFTVVVRPAAGGSSFALAGTAAATAAMTGAIAHAYAVAGAANASASMTGALAHAYALAGLAEAVATMTGDATLGSATFALAGTAAGTASATGAVAIAYPLSGSADAVATLAGALAHAYGLAGAAGGEATVTGSISHAYGLAGSADGTASATGAIAHVYGLGGTAAATAAMVGDITTGVVTLGDAVITFVVRHDGSIDFSVRHVAALDFTLRHEASLSFS